MQMSADIPYSFTGRFQKNSLCIPMAETSTSRSVRCYTTLWNVTHIFRVSYFTLQQDRAPARRAREAVDAKSLFRILCGRPTVDPYLKPIDYAVGNSARPRLKESDQGRGRAAAARDEQ